MPFEVLNLAFMLLSIFASVKGPEIPAFEYERLIVQSDPHSLSAFRVNGPLSNFPQFAEAYGCKTGTKMVRDTRCQVW